MVKVTIKWNKQMYEGVELDPSQPPLVFKQRVSELTGVPVERQKLMGKGLWKLTLKDDEDLSKLPLKVGLCACKALSCALVKSEREAMDDDDTQTHACVPMQTPTHIHTYRMAPASCSSARRRW